MTANGNTRFTEKAKRSKPEGKQTESAKKAAGVSSPGQGTVHVLIDNTGLQIYGAGQWLEEKHGVKSRRNWRKLHLELDADSGDIIAQVMTDQDAADASQVEVLLDQFETPIGQFTADGAYDGNPTIRQLGYPAKNALRGWYREYVEKRNLRVQAVARPPRFSEAQKQAALARPSKYPRGICCVKCNVISQRVSLNERY